MSTYTNYTVKARENLSRIRNPGCSDDGLSPERVIFSNPNNIYNGIFRGQVDNLCATFNDCTFNGGTINDATLNNVTLMYGDQVIKIADLTSNVSELSTTLDEFLTSTLPEMQLSIAAAATSEGMKQLSILLINKINTDVSNILSAIDDISAFFLSNDNELCMQINGINYFISNDVVPFMEGMKDFQQNAELSIESLSVELSNSNKKIDQLVISCNDLCKNDSMMSNYISALSDDNKEIWKNIKGGLNFKDVLSVEHDYDSISSLFICNLSSYDVAPSAIAALPIRNGFFYPLVTANKMKHYKIEGLEVTNGDWLIAKDNFIVSDATSVDMTVFDAQDADAVRAGASNEFTGDNTFAGHSQFEGRVDAMSLSAASLSIQLSDIIYDADGTTMLDLSNDIYSKTGTNTSDISSISSIVDVKSYLGTFSTTGTTIDSLSSIFRSVGLSDGAQLFKGTWIRSGEKLENIPDATSISGFIGINDYLVVNRNVMLSDIIWTYIDVIRDPYTEVISVLNSLNQLSGEMKTVSTDIMTYVDNKHDELKSMIDDTNLSVNGLSNAVSSLAVRCMHYNGDLNVGDDTTWSYCLEHAYHSSSISSGTMNRISCDISVTDYLSNSVMLNANDYIVFNKTIVDFEHSTLSDIDIIRDAQIEAEKLSTDMMSNYMHLSNAIDSKIFIDRISSESLCALHIGQNDFYQKVINEAIISNELYIVSSDYINAYGEQVKNLAEPTLSNDAATKNYVDAVNSGIGESLSSLAKCLYDQLSTVEDGALRSLDDRSKISGVISAVIEIRDTLSMMRTALSNLLAR